ncbi:MAG: alkaline shock response membrane anchor protein AmaP [Kiritimatiellaceae bacterium]|nr:alkaline shock response membrane anchor protein AmaP [Kiritimatiellaceae bacterium]
MTKFLHVLSGLVIWFLFAALGGALVHANIPGVTISLFDVLPPLQSIKTTGIGGVIILLAMLYLITFAPRRQKARYISFDSGNGAVSISVSAVRDFIRKLGDEFGAVVGIDPKIRSEKDAISVDLDVKVQTGVRIPEFSQALQNRVREGMQDSLGILEVKEVKVRIQEIVGTPRPSRR